MASLFPRPDPDEPASQASASDTFLRSIEDAEAWLPPDHAKEAEPDDLPASLVEALRCFLLSCAIRDLRAAAGEPGKGGGLHRSMLVNVSRFTAVQNRLAALLHVQVDDIRSAVRLHGALPPAKAAQSGRIRDLEATFRCEFAGCGQNWADVLGCLHDAMAPVRVQPVNQGTGAASLDYSITDKPPGVRVIAVGGNSLSRGLTLEGLSTSYFLRNSKAYDTLLQMGRWFGYRDGYGDLCRLWVTDEADGWYRHITDATAELKGDFARMRRRKATPREFGLRVRTHPDTLIITARNKMTTGVEVEGERELSFMGRMIATSRLVSDRARNDENRQLMSAFVTRLVGDHGLPAPSPHGGASLWKAVPAPAVADFLDTFLVHPRNFDFQGDAMTDFLRSSAGGGNGLLSHWTVALLTTGDGQEVSLEGLPGVVLNAKKRRVDLKKDDGSLLVSGKGARVGSPRDVRHGLSVEAAAAVTATKRGEDPLIRMAPEGDYRAEMQAPLLLLYLVEGKEVAKGGPPAGTPYRNGLLLPAIALHFPGSKDPDAPRHLVKYRLNRVAQAELLPADVEEDDVEDPDADD